MNKKLKQAQRLYEKNQQGRAAFMQHIGEALQLPVKQLAEHAAEIHDSKHLQLANDAQTIVRLVDEIQLLNMLETDSWKTSASEFSIQSLIDEVALSMLPIIKRKGLQLLINNNLAPPLPH